jgi:hypothetical protein
MQTSDIVVTLLGSIGAAMILYCFVVNLTKRLAADSRTYLTTNLVGGILVALNCLWFAAYPAFVINVVWAGASIWGLWKQQSPDNSSD